MSIKQSAFSLVEVIVALAVFSVIAGAGLNSFVPVIQQNRQALEIVKANRLAEEGLEAARSIKNRNFYLLASGTKGIGISTGGVWALMGTTDTTDKYTRRVSVAKAMRDVGGSIVSSGGVTDPDTYVVKSWVTWNYSIGQTKMFVLDTILTNWKKKVEGFDDDALLIYGNGTVSPSRRFYISPSNGLSTRAFMPLLVGVSGNYVIRTSPTKKEAIVGVSTDTGNLYIYCYNGVTWTQDWSVGVGGSATTRRFDIAYETNSGDAVVLYSTNTATTNELAFRTKAGSNACGSANWAAATNFNPQRTSGLISWVKLYSNPIASSNLIGALWVDWDKDLSGAIWNGTAFANEMTTVGETKIEAINTGASFPDVEAFDLAYESVTGDLMTIWGTSSGTDGINGVRYRLCSGNLATCTWGSVTIPPTWADDATNLDLSADPNSDYMVFASIGNAGADLQIGFWGGVGWTNTANVDITSQAPLAGTKLVATGWLNNGATKRSIVAYNDAGATGISYYTGNLGVFTSQPAFIVTPRFANPQKWYEIATNPLSKDQLMLVVSDNGNDLFTKRLVMSAVAAFTWTNSGGGTAVELNLGNSLVKPFGFAWWQQ